MKVSGLTAGAGVTRAVQLVRFAEVCSVRARLGVLVMTRVTEPSGARRMGPKLGGVGSVTGTVRVTILAFNVTAPIRANAVDHPQIRSACGGPAIPSRRGRRQATASRRWWRSRTLRKG